MTVVDDLARLVGERLRAARHEHGLSLGALAEAAHVGKGSLSEIENGTRNPTLSTLYALAGALGVPLATLIADRSGVRLASPGIEARLLDVSHDGQQTVEVYRLRLEPGSRHRSPAHGPGVVEHMFVTSGQARVGRVDEEAEIGAGQAAQWASDVPHGYAALGPVPVKAVLVIRSPGAAGRGRALRPARVAAGPALQPDPRYDRVRWRHLTPQASLTAQASRVGLPHSVSEPARWNIEPAIAGTMEH